MQGLADFVKSNSRPDSNTLAAQLAEANHVIECQKYEIALLKQKLEDESKKEGVVVQTLSKLVESQRWEIVDLKINNDALRSNNESLIAQNKKDVADYNNLKADHELLKLNHCRMKMELNNENTDVLLDQYLLMAKAMLCSTFDQPIPDDMINQAIVQRKVTKAHIKTIVDEINRLRIKHQAFYKFICNPNPQNKPFCEIAIIILTNQAENLSYPIYEIYNCLVQNKAVLQYLDTLFEIEGC
jgi:hypothetical protein